MSQGNASIDIRDRELMQRCFLNALQFSGFVAPNPLVGCVLTDEQGTILSEGAHEVFGESHAERNAISRLQANASPHTAYVNLEPCAHHGKTPPCSDALITAGLKRVVVGCEDPFDRVAGKGVQKLEAAGVRVDWSELATRARFLNRRFLTFHEKKRPYIILKWAQTSDGFTARKDGSSKWISGIESRAATHWFRHCEAGILVGRNTALKDDPTLNCRIMGSSHPVRISFDRQGSLPKTLKLFSSSPRTVVFSETSATPCHSKVESWPLTIEELLQKLHQLGIQSVLVEGGSKTLRKFFASNLWDEARVFTAHKVFGIGMAAPELQSEPHFVDQFGEDTFQVHYNALDFAFDEWCFRQELAPVREFLNSEAGRELSDSQ